MITLSFLYDLEHGSTTISRKYYPHSEFDLYSIKLELWQHKNCISVSHDCFKNGFRYNHYYERKE